MKDLETSLKPYKDRFHSHIRLPQTPLKRDDILDQIREINTLEEDKWKDGVCLRGGLSRQSGPY